MSLKSSSASVVFAGFRETGKTTFLVALWHTVVNKQVPGALTLEHFYEGDREYISSRYAEWLEYEPVKRTLVDHSSPIVMTLRDGQKGRLLQLGIPDLSGETFKAQFEERRASPSFASSIRAATGVAIFINPSRVDDPTLIREVWDALNDEYQGEGAVTEAPSPPATASDIQAPVVPSPVEVDASTLRREPALQETSESASGSSNEAKDFDAELCCTQVKYVDLLQHFIEHGASTPLRCAVIVSAMDTLDGTPYENHPEEFIRIRMSLLNQFLGARRDLFQSRIYGVSAQGGEYDPVSVESLAKRGAGRIRVCGAGIQDNDITRPVRWLAFGEE